MNRPNPGRRFVDTPLMVSHLEGLKQAKRFKDGTCHVDLFKLPHHGSDHNVSTEFFRQVTADHYVVSGNGEHGNPEIATLQMLSEARGQDEFTLYITNEEPRLSEFSGKRKPRANSTQSCSATRHPCPLALTSGMRSRAKGRASWESATHYSAAATSGLYSVCPVLPIDWRSGRGALVAPRTIHLRGWLTMGHCNGSPGDRPASMLAYLAGVPPALAVQRTTTHRRSHESSGRVPGKRHREETLHRVN